MNVAGSPVWAANVPVIDDGDTCANAEHGATATALANRTEVLRHAARCAAPFAVPLIGVANQSSRFASEVAGLVFYWYQTSVASQGGLWIPLGPLPVGIKIVGCKMQWVGGQFTGQSHAALPATMPDISIRRQGPGAATAEVGTATDSSGSVAIYDQLHDVSIAGLNHTVLADNDYFVRVRGEAGTNAEDNHAALYSVYLTLALP